MKVYDLMHQLATMPAGADVKIKLLMPLQDIVANGAEQIFDGIEHYGIEKDVHDTDKTISDAIVYLYSD